MKGIILSLILLYASVSDIQTHRVKDVASVMILITGFIGITASEIPKHLFDGMLMNLLSVRIYCCHLKKTILRQNSVKLF